MEIESTELNIISSASFSHDISNQKLRITRNGLTTQGIWSKLLILLVRYHDDILTIETAIHTLRREGEEGPIVSYRMYVDWDDGLGTVCENFEGNKGKVVSGLLSRRKTPRTAEII